jgi:hypothetical protein
VNFVRAGGTLRKYALLGSRVVSVSLTFGERQESERLWRERPGINDLSGEPRRKPLRHPAAQGERVHHERGIAVDHLTEGPRQGIRMHWYARTSPAFALINGPVIVGAGFGHLADMSPQSSEARL